MNKVNGNEDTENICSKMSRGHWENLVFGLNTEDRGKGLGIREIIDGGDKIQIS